MVQCPICGKDQVVFVVGPRRTRCPYCGTSWVQEDGAQTAVVASGPPASSASAPGP